MWTEEQLWKAAYDYEKRSGGVVAAAFMAGAKYIINNTQTMNRNKLIENLNNLSDFEKLSLGYYVQEIMDEIPDRDFSNIYVESRLSHYYDYYSRKYPGHPFEYLYKKLMDGVNDKISYL